MRLLFSFLCILFIAYFLEDFVVFKFLPLIISIVFTYLLIESYYRKNSIILKFARKWLTIDKKEELYIHKSTLFWIFIAFLNLFLHVGVLLLGNTTYWAMYASFGWYLIFAFGGVLQFLHRKFVFLKEPKCVQK
ncbi:MAG: hypothetical protein PHN38_02730 [Sulfurospirillaceae bacterium]|nr:hypothetical protein [Sulfurospirillaceae bacterium]